MASGHVSRIERPNTWLHRPMLQNVKKVLANPEPSTHDPLADVSRSQPLIFRASQTRLPLRWKPAPAGAAEARRIRIAQHGSHCFPRQ